MLRVSRVGCLVSAVSGPLMRQELDVYTLHTEPSVSERTCLGSGGSSPAAEGAMGQAAPRLFRLSPVRIITPPTPRTHLLVTSHGQDVETLEPSNKTMLLVFSDIGETEMYFRIAFSILRRHDADGYGRTRCEMYCTD